MHYPDLKYLADIADCGSITAAAKKNYMTQQSMSSQLKKLEERYQTPLIIRSTPVQLTPAGERLCRAAREVMRIYEEAEADVAKLVEAEKKLTVGLTLSGAPPFLSQLLEEFSAVDGDSIEISVLSDCRQGTVQLENADVVFSDEQQDERFAAVTLLEDTFVVTVRKTLLEKIYGEQSAAVAEEMLRTGRLSLLDRLPFAMFNPERLDAIHAVVREYLSGRNARIINMDSLDLQMSMCRSGQCAAFTMSDIVEHREKLGDEFLIFPIREPAVSPSLKVFYRTDRPVSECVRKFLKITEEHFQQGSRADELTIDN